MGRGRKNEDIIGRWAEILALTLARAGVSERLSSEIAIESTASIRWEFGGTAAYISRGRADSDERAAQAYAMFQEGRSIREIASEFDCTDRWVWILLQREKVRLTGIRKHQEELINGRNTTRINHKA